MYDYWNSINVIRWHNRPDIPSQTTGMHTIGMLVLLIKLHPNPSADLMQAVIRHDLGERLYGDFPSDAKRKFPELKAIDEQGQRDFDNNNELRELNLTEEDKLWLSFLDQHEVLYYLMSLPQLHIYDSVKRTYNAVVEKAEATKKQLQAFGYMTEPSETKH